MTDERATNGFSASDAALEGFQVLRRHWRVVAGWAGFNLLAMVAMVVVTVIVALVTAALMGGGPNTSQLTGVLGGVVAGVGTLIVEIVMLSGLYRLMLRPQEPGFLHLRLGGTEIRLVAVALIYAVALVAVLALGIVAAGFARHVALVLYVVVMAVAVAVTVWLALRLSVALPATFAQSRIGLGSSWRLTRGRVWPLLGMALLAACVAAIIVIVFWLALFLVLGLSTGFRGLLGVMTGADAKSEPVVYMIQIGAQLVFAPVLGVIGQAPFVAAYRTFSGSAVEAT